MKLINAHPQLALILVFLILFLPSFTVLLNQNPGHLMSNLGISCIGSIFLMAFLFGSITGTAPEQSNDPTSEPDRN